MKVYHYQIQLPDVGYTETVILWEHEDALAEKLLKEHLEELEITKYEAKLVEKFDIRDRSIIFSDLG